MRPSLCNTSSLPRVRVLWRGLSSGGPVDTAHTTGTRIRTLIHTMHTAASYGLTLVG
jgi:hypothetical protein